MLKEMGAIAGAQIHGRQKSADFDRRSHGDASHGEQT
jgi:hypothetical protein